MTGDRHRVERDTLAKHLKALIEFAAVTLAEEEKHPAWDDVRAARKALAKIYRGRIRLKTE